MGLDPAMRTQWRERRLGHVSIASPRGVVALILIALSFAGAFLPAILTFYVVFIQGDTETTPTITRNLLAINFLFNAVVLLILPIAAITISHPGSPGAVARRLRLMAGPRTPLHLLIGAGTAFLSLAILAGILYALGEFGIYDAEQSELTLGIEAILDWSIVLALPLVAAVTEEVFFRGLLQPRVGLVASSLLFGIVHTGYGTWIQIVVPMLLGFLFGILFQRTKSLWAPIAAHFTFNFLVLASAMLAKNGAAG